MKKILITIVLIFASVDIYSDSLFPVVVDGNVGYIDSKGNIVIEPEFDTEYTEQNIIYQNKKLTEVKFPDYAYFSDGKAAVVKKELFWFIWIHYYNTYNVIDKKGNILFDNWSENFRLEKISNGYGIYAKPDEAETSFDYVYGFIDNEFNIIDSAKYKNVSQFNYGLALFKEKKLNGYIDTKGNIIIQPKYKVSHPFSEELALVLVDGKYGFINTEGKLVIDPQFEQAWSFHNGYARIYQNGKYKFIDKSGNFTKNNSYSYAGDFSEGIAMIKEGDYFGFIDTNFNIIIKPQFLISKSIKEGMIPFSDGKLWGYTDKQGNEIIKPQFDLVHQFNNGLAIVWKNNEQVYINKQGEIISKVKWNNPLFHRIFGN